MLTRIWKLKSLFLLFCNPVWTLLSCMWFFGQTVESAGINWRKFVVEGGVCSWKKLFFCCHQLKLFLSVFSQVLVVFGVLLSHGQTEVADDFAQLLNTLCISQCSLTIESILSLQQNKNTHTCKYSKHPTTINKQSISLDQQNYCRNNEKYSIIVLLLKFSFNPVLGPYFLRWSGPLFSLTDHTCQLQNSKKKLENNHQWCNLLESWRTSLCTFQHFTDSNSQVFMLYDFVISFGVTFTEFLWEQKKSN